MPDLGRRENVHVITAGWRLLSLIGRILIQPEIHLCRNQVLVIESWNTGIVWIQTGGQWDFIRERTFEG